MARGFLCTALAGFCRARPCSGSGSVCRSSLCIPICFRFFSQRVARVVCLCMGLCRSRTSWWVVRLLLLSFVFVSRVLVVSFLELSVCVVRSSAVASGVYVPQPYVVRKDGGLLHVVSRCLGCVAVSSYQFLYSRGACRPLWGGWEGGGRPWELGVRGVGIGWVLWGMGSVLWSGERVCLCVGVVVSLLAFLCPPFSCRVVMSEEFLSGWCV